MSDKKSKTLKQSETKRTTPLDPYVKSMDRSTPNNESEITYDIAQAIQQTTEESLQEIDAEYGWFNYNNEFMQQDSLSDIMQNINEEDMQTRLFAQFISVASSFASLNYAKKLSMVPVLVSQIQQLFNDMRKEVREFADVASDVQNLILKFQQLVLDLRHQVNMTLPHIQAIHGQMEVVADVLCNNLDVPIAAEDQNDITLALSQMRNGVNNFQKIAKESMRRSQDLGKKIEQVHDVVSKKKMIVEQRLDFSAFYKAIGVPASSVIGSYLGALFAGKIIAADIVGGVGALVIGGIAVPPLAGILACGVIGASFVGSVVYLVKKLWDNHNYKALSYLDKILLLLRQLLLANTQVMEKLDKSQEAVNTLLTQTDQIKLCLISQRQRKINSKVCTNAIGIISSLILALEDVAKIDVEQKLFVL